MSLSAKACVVVGLNLGLSACVYYNVFYNAERLYDQGLKAKQAGPNNPATYQRLFEQSIEKSRRVIQRHPGSRYVDDALLLMGKAYFQKGEPEAAGAVLQQLEREYPESKQADEGLFWLAQAQRELKDFQAARESLTQLVAGTSRSRWAREALFQLAEVDFAAEDFEAATAHYRDFLERVSDSSLHDQVLFKLAQAQFKQGQFDQALESFHQLSQEARDPAFRREVSLWVANTLSKSQRHPEAVEAYRVLLTFPSTPQEEAEIYLLMAREALAQENVEGALESNLQAARILPRSSLAARAFSRNGDLYLGRLKDYRRARESFEQAVLADAGSPEGREAREKLEALLRIEQLRELAKNEEGEKAATTQFLLAQDLLLRVQDPQGALQAYEALVERFPQSLWTAKASYSMGWIWEHHLMDTARAREEYRRVIERFPDTPSADYARLALGLPPPERPAGFYEEDRILGPLLALVPPLPPLQLQAPPTAPVDTAGALPRKGAKVPRLPGEPVRGDTLLGPEPEPDTTRGEP